MNSSGERLRVKRLLCRKIKSNQHKARQVTFLSSDCRALQIYITMFVLTMDAVAQDLSHFSQVRHSQYVVLVLVGSICLLFMVIVHISVGGFFATRSVSLEKLRKQAATTPLDREFLLLTTPMGRLQGRVLERYRYNGGNKSRYCTVFYGVPFGGSTSGINRFKRPTKATSWMGTLDARKPKSPCVQSDYSTPGYSIVARNSTENCLHLNVWIPVTRSTLNSSRRYKYDIMSNRTVMIYLYGGSFTNGGNSYSFYDSRELVFFGEVIVVVPNYRLGPFGFLNAGIPEAPGNVGLMDQALAIEWVYENIAAFGGNPNSIVVFGESAGAISAGYHLFSNSTAQRIKRVILQSGSPMTPLPTNVGETAVRNFRNLSDSLGCTRLFPNGTFAKKDSLQCLLRKDAHDIARVAKNESIMFYPSFGGSVLSKSIYELIKETPFNPNISVLIGNVHNEGDMFVQQYIFVKQKVVSSENVTSPGLESIYNKFSFLYHAISFTTFAKLFYVYRKQVDSYLEELVGDLFFVCPSRYFGRVLAKRNISVHYYLLPFKSSLSPWKGSYSTHTDDVILTFGLPLHQNRRRVRAAERHLSARIIRIWTNFSKYGTFPSDKLYGPWPTFTNERPVVATLDVFGQTYSTSLRDEYCDTLDNIYDQL